MVRHLETRAKAMKYLRTRKNYENLSVRKKLVGHSNRIKKPFVVCSYIEWMNLN